MAIEVIVINHISIKLSIVVRLNTVNDDESLLFMYTNISSFVLRIRIDRSALSKNIDELLVSLLQLFKYFL